MSCFRISSFITAAGLIAAFAPAAFGQKWEVGAGGGASIYSAKSISAAAGSVDAKFKPGYGFSAYVGQIGNRLGGELRYTWQSNEMELSGLSRSFTMGGRTQAVHYDLSIYLNGKNSGARPYLLVGGGMKQYTGTGAATAIQPLGSIAVLTNTSEWKPLITAGGGVRIATGSKSHLRAELRLFLTETPTKVITPVTGSLGGWYINFMPMVSLSYVW